MHFVRMQTLGGLQLSAAVCAVCASCDNAEFLPTITSLVCLGIWCGNTLISGVVALQKWSND